MQQIRGKTRMLSSSSHTTTIYHKCRHDLAYL